MLETILGIGRAEIYSDGGIFLDSIQIGRLREFLDRRSRGEPLQHILGTVEFRNVTLKIDRRALIPRPETEGLVDIGLEMIRALDHPGILDIGTGCGAIALSLIQEHSGARAVGVDISAEALELAAENGEALGLSRRVIWISVDLFSADFSAQFEDRFDLIISNPPYVAENEYRQLPAEIRNYEPPVALLAGREGLDAIRSLAEIGKDLLGDQKCLICEIGERQSDSSIQIFSGAGWDAHVRKDLSGKPRYLIASR